MRGNASLKRPREVVEFRSVLCPFSKCFLHSKTPTFQQLRRIGLGIVGSVYGGRRLAIVDRRALLATARAMQRQSEHATVTKHWSAALKQTAGALLATTPTTDVEKFVSVVNHVLDEEVTVSTQDIASYLTAGDGSSDYLGALQRRRSDAVAAVECLEVFDVSNDCSESNAAPSLLSSAIPPTFLQRKVPVLVPVKNYTKCNAPLLRDAVGKFCCATFPMMSQVALIDLQFTCDERAVYDLLFTASENGTTIATSAKPVVELTSADVSCIIVLKAHLLSHEALRRLIGVCVKGRNSRRQTSRVSEDKKREEDALQPIPLLIFADADRCDHLQATKEESVLAWLFAQHRDATPVQEASERRQVDLTQLLLDSPSAAGNGQQHEQQDVASDLRAALEYLTSIDQERTQWIENVSERWPRLTKLVVVQPLLQKREYSLPSNEEPRGTLEESKERQENQHTGVVVVVQSAQEAKRLEEQKLLELCVAHNAQYRVYDCLFDAITLIGRWSSTFFCRASRQLSTRVLRNAILSAFAAASPLSSDACVSDCDIFRLDYVEVSAGVVLGVRLRLASSAPADADARVDVMLRSVLEALAPVLKFLPVESRRQHQQKPFATEQQTLAFHSVREPSTMSYPNYIERLLFSKAAAAAPRLCLCVGSRVLLTRGHNRSGEFGVVTSFSDSATSHKCFSAEATRFLEQQSHSGRTHSGFPVVRLDTDGAEVEVTASKSAQGGYRSLHHYALLYRALPLKLANFCSLSNVLHTDYCDGVQHVFNALPKEQQYKYEIAPPPSLLSPAHHRSSKLGNEEESSLFSRITLKAAEM